MTKEAGTIASSSEEGEILLIDKPLEWTSFDVVKKIRSLLRVRKVGHAGALDPKATGLLIVCTGRQTKNIECFVGLEKEYIGVLELGVRTRSFDTETAVYEKRDFTCVTDDRIKNVASEFLGTHEQLPPMYSAVKYGGKPLYCYAREGKVVDRAKREITIGAFDIRAIRRPYVDFRVVCSRGTYIRTLIDDMGQRLGCGASLIKLQRIRIGDNHLRNALSLDQLARRQDVQIKKDSRNNENCSAI
jgi:tRNA pseudouridine55 synthase